MLDCHENMASPTALSSTGKKLIKSNGGLRMINIIDDEKSPFEIEEPIWKPDAEVQYIFYYKINIVYGTQHTGI